MQNNSFCFQKIYPLRLCVEIKSKGKAMDNWGFAIGRVFVESADCESTAHPLVIYFPQIQRQRIADNGSPRLSDLDQNS
jgi:hypothetical protein